MGYRSNGLWVIRGPVNNIIAAWTACRLVLSPPAPDEWDNFTVFRNGDTGTVRFEYNDWKWYESFPEIQFFESVWNHFALFEEDQDDKVISGRRIRIGEDDDDTENICFGNDSIDIYINRAISDDEDSSGEPLTPLPP